MGVLKVETNGSSTNGGGVRLSISVVLQVLAVLVAIGIAWGTITTRLNALEAAQNADRLYTVEVLKKLDAIQTDVTRLKAIIERERLGRSSSRP